MIDHRCLLSRVFSYLSDEMHVSEKWKEDVIARENNLLKHTFQIVNFIWKRIHVLYVLDDGNVIFKDIETLLMLDCPEGFLYVRSHEYPLECLAVFSLQMV